MNLAEYQEWNATYRASDPNGANTAELLHSLFSMDERVAFLSQHPRLAASLKRELATYATLGSTPYTAQSAAECTAFNAAYETLRIAFYEAIKADIGGVVTYVDDLICTTQKEPHNER